MSGSVRGVPSNGDPYRDQHDATRNGDHAAERLLRKDNRGVRVRPALDGQDWNDMLTRDRAGEPLGTDDRLLD